MIRNSTIVKSVEKTLIQEELREDVLITRAVNNKTGMPVDPHSRVRGRKTESSKKTKG
jgi:hypothetical protein